MLRALIVAFYQWEQQRLALRIKSCLINTIYAKSLRINTLATSDESSQGSRGQTYNLISEDCATIGSVISHNLDNVLGPSISICGTVFWTWYLLGWGALLSLLAVLTVLYIASNWAVVRAFRVGVRMNSAHDATIGRISELIRSIKSIKASASENKHLSDVLRYRNAFLGLWAAQKRYQALLNSFWMLCPDLIICLCFFLFFVVQGATFDLSAAIAVSTLIRQLSLPLGVLPEAIKNLSYSTLLLENLKRC
ncbi:hypothetical protein BT69DRAFT_969185 [Atractiella rhizophila]|nr:hypothetical protein BT69DRAFT_969185 [Atractiella rhizophila]